MRQIINYSTFASCFFEELAKLKMKNRKDMKKNLMLCLALAGMTTAMADEYPYLMFQNNDGTTTSVASEGLTITFSDGKLIAKNADGSKTFTLTELNKMFFSKNADVTGIEETPKDASAEPVEVFTLAGISVGRFENMKEAQNTLSKGCYVVKSASGTLKITVK